MIKKVTNENKQILMNYIAKEPAINLFIIGDVEQFGLDVDFQEVYLQYENTTITACVLRYYQSVIVYSDHPCFNTLEIIDLINEFDYIRLSGKTSVINQLIPKLSNKGQIDESYLCKLTNQNDLITPTEIIHHAKISDIDSIIPLLKSVGFYHDTYKASNIRKLENKAGRIYFIEKDNQVVASASTAIETTVSAMIGGVATLEKYRNNGYASQIVSALCNDLFSENKTPCLFFHNPNAGRIYHRLGFVDIGKWTMISYD